ncbi:MAG: DUF362 domain-containing protein [Nitrososphaerota archaeon]|nr:DUF362 domain-containing protein [Candidatus Bathyarchaeota archaeon]MDW8048988.1 DUF362 domain-containing protein [Nitrososphaerota archaeon]
MSEVVVLRGDDPVKMVEEALGKLGADKAFGQEEKILIKPNYINDRPPSTGVTTDARVIEGVVKFLSERGFRNMVIGEGSGLSDTMRAYKVAGVDEVAKKWNVELIDLNHDEYIIADVPDPLALEKVRISKTALNCAVISVPKLKLHRAAGVTLSLKNLMGVVQPKQQIHNHLHEKIADLASLLKPRLAVIDGIVGCEGYELAEKPVKMDLIIAGLDPVAVDTISALIMGFDPKKVRHIALAAKKGLGICDPNNIRVIGEPVEKVRKEFKPSFSHHIISRLV